MAEELLEADPYESTSRFASEISPAWKEKDLFLLSKYRKSVSILDEQSFLREYGSNLMDWALTVPSGFYETDKLGEVFPSTLHIIGSKLGGSEGSYNIRNIPNEFTKDFPYNGDHSFLGYQSPSQQLTRLPLVIRREDITLAMAARNSLTPGVTTLEDLKVALSVIYNKPNLTLEEAYNDYLTNPISYPCEYRKLLNHIYFDRDSNQFKVDEVLGLGSAVEYEPLAAALFNRDSIFRPEWDNFFNTAIKKGATSIMDSLSTLGGLFGKKNKIFAAFGVDLAEGKDDLPNKVIPTLPGTFVRDNVPVEILRLYTQRHSKPNKES